MPDDEDGSKSRKTAPVTVKLSSNERLALGAVALLTLVLAAVYQYVPLTAIAALPSCPATGNCTAQITRAPDAASTAVLLAIAAISFLMAATGLAWSIKAAGFEASVGVKTEVSDGPAPTDTKSISQDSMRKRPLAAIDFVGLKTEDLVAQLRKSEKAKQLLRDLPADLALAAEGEWRSRYPQELLVDALLDVREPPAGRGSFSYYLVAETPTRDQVTIRVSRGGRGKTSPTARVTG